MPKRKTKSRQQFTLLWQADAYNRTARSAAEEFARTYWDKPRRVVWGEGGTFQVEDGVRTYSVHLQPARDTTPAIYQIGWIT